MPAQSDQRPLAFNSTWSEAICSIAERFPRALGKHEIGCAQPSRGDDEMELRQDAPHVLVTAFPVKAL